MPLLSRHWIRISRRYEMNCARGEPRRDSHSEREQGVLGYEGTKIVAGTTRRKQPCAYYSQERREVPDEDHTELRRHYAHPLLLR